ncbi:MAG: HU family DNA-binding protein [Bacteroidales bacterium]|jgi:predicted histone-like DNA-binding protein|nr:HU family DNA-binding protein [Bacteroidales bacterium]
MVVRTTEESMGFARVTRNIHTGENPGMKFGIVKARPGRVSTDQIAKEIAETTTLTKAEAKFAMASAMEIISKYVCMGYKVDVEDFGTFEAKISAEFQPTLAQVTLDTIRSIGMGFRPCKEVSERLKNVHRFFTDMDITGLQP